MAKITIFGSCRQDSVYNYYSVTPLRDQLTYPHYASETLQAIKYASGLISDNDIQTDIAFRSYLLDGKIRHQKKLKSDFLKTELFIVEIASRKTYQFGSTYLHHIIEDPNYGCPDRSDIIKGFETEHEIEEKIIEMKTIFNPRPFFLVTHFYTKNSGIRYELVKLIKRLGHKHNIPVFDPVEELGGLTVIRNYLENEEVLTHYNSEGHKAIGLKYVKFIETHFMFRSHYKLISPTFLRKLKSKIISSINKFTGNDR